MLSLSPFLSRSTGAGGADDTVVVEADTLARVADGETIVLTGFPVSSEVSTPASGTDHRRPRPPIVTRKRTELVVLLTPRILTSVAD
jgi:type II secretory pathway component GspD/PulD (secretin)